jgi:serine protease Do
MRAAPQEHSNRASARPAVIVVAIIGGWAVALAYAAGYTGSRVAQVTPAVAGEVVQPAPRPAGFADVVEKVKPAVFGIKVKIEQGEGTITPESFTDESLPRMGAPKRAPGNGSNKGLRTETAQGAGFFISPDGYGITSSHVMERSTRAEITTDDGASYTARLVGSDGQSDLALLKVEGRADFPYVRLADREPRIGD